MINRRSFLGTGVLALLAAGCQTAPSAKCGASGCCKKGKVPLMGGGTDSAAFTQGGFRSVGITGLSHKLEDYYHTRRDSFDNLNETGLENCYRATIQLIEDMDKRAWSVKQEAISK